MRWSNTPTAAERHCEHANVSLTERLRRDFGIDASESEDDENKGNWFRYNIPNPATRISASFTWIFGVNKSK